MTASTPTSQPSLPPDEVQTLVDLLALRAGRSHDVVGYRFLEDGENESAQLTYGQLDSAARRLASVVLQSVQPGERVLLCLPTGPAYIEAFFACQLAGVIAVPTVPPESGRLERTLPQIQAVLEGAGARAVITDRRSRAAFDQSLGDGSLGDLIMLQHEDAAEAEALAEIATPAASDVAFLLYTSGSTGKPKGVKISHGNALDNLRSFPGWAERPPTGFVSWLPYYLDLGLFFTLLHPLYHGVVSVTMPPLAFVQKPIRWLRALSTYGASATSGPNFAYELAIRYISDEERHALDLSHVDLALSGGERVRAGTLERFAASFAPCGFRPEAFYPSYGMTEATATISGPLDIEAPRVRVVSRRALEQGLVVDVAPAGAASDDAERVVANGVIVDGATALIVDPQTRVALNPGSVGEVWLRGSSVSSGYWQRPDITEKRFGAQLDDGESDDDSHGGYFRTGDLAFFDEEGHIYPVGRLSDLIILRGVNYHPELLEPTLSAAHADLRPGFSAAFSIDVDDEERLVLVQEVRAKAELEPEEVFLAVRKAMEQRHGVEPHAIVLVAQGSLEKTASGKIKRRATRQAFANDRLKVLAEQRQASAMLDFQARALSASATAGARRHAEEIEAWLVDYMKRQTGADDIDVRRATADYALPSIKLVTMIGELGEWLGTSLPPTLAWDYSTLEQLAAHISAQSSTPSPRGRSQAPRSQPVAIVGMSCRLPGAPDLDAYWRMLEDGVDAVAEIPAERWDVDALYSRDPAAPGKMTTRWMGSLPDLDLFDAEFFNISPREADHIDPRQRLMLELCYETLVDAGMRLEDLRSRPVGVFVAVLRDDYGTMLFSDLARIDAYSGSGIQNTIVANRLSYVFDFQGPSLVVDTACSGSLVALHQACQALGNGECEMAIAGGVNLNQMPDGNIFFSKAGALAADGRCKTFDHRADGIVRSEGAGLVVLKPLDRAIADGDEIWATIRGTAVNQDGNSNGMMAPNGKAQEALLIDAWQRSGLDPRQLQYVEAHGTGTSLGDPIEVNAIGAALGRMAPDMRTEVHLGSVKTNFGHTEAAAGVAGVIKTALAMKHRQLPPSLHFEKPNPLIPFDSLPLRVQSELGPWPRPDETLVAGVSSFGFGGTNAHVVLEEAPAQSRPRLVDDAPQLLTLSARDPEARRDLAAAYADTLESLHAGATGEAVDADAPSFSEVCSTAALQRDAFEYRLALSAASADDAAARLRSWLGGREHAVAVSERAAIRRPSLAFVFSGQGSHWLGMGLGLMNEPIFSRVVERCDAEIRDLAGWSLLDQLRADEATSRLSDTEITQPAIFAMQVALANLWLSWGVEPDAVVGQSLGEVAAAHVCGALTFEDAVKVVVHRGELMSRPEAAGKTGLLGVPLDQARELIAAHREHVDIAGASSPTATLVSGDSDAMTALFAELETGSVFARLLRGVDVAFHSPPMDPLVPKLVEALGDIEARAEAIPFYSSVDAGKVPGEALGADYWGRNLRQPFLFSATFEKLLKRRFKIFLEISPHPVIADPMKQNLAHHGKSATLLRSLRRARPGVVDGERSEMLENLGELFVRGQKINWRSLFRKSAKRAPLPSYPWQRQHFWIDQIETAGSAPSPFVYAGSGGGASPSVERDEHPLLGRASGLSVPPFQRFWELDLDGFTLHYLTDHRVEGVLVIAGAVHAELTRAAASRLAGDAGIELQDLHFAEPMVLLEGQKRRLQVSLTPAGSGTWQAQTASRPVGAAQTEWTRHLSATVTVTDSHSAAKTPSASRDALDLDALRQRLDDHVSGQAHYQEMLGFGLQYGPAFRCVRSVWRRPGEALAQLAMPADLIESAASYGIHPGLLDCAFQAMAQAPLPDDMDAGAMLPVSIESLQLYRGIGSKLWAHCHMRDRSGDGFRIADIRLYDDQGQPVGEIRGLRLESLSGSRGQVRLADMLYQVRWTERALETVPPGAVAISAEATPAEAAPSEATPSEEALVAAGSDEGEERAATWLIFADRRGFAGSLATRLAERGDRVVQVLQGVDFAPDHASNGTADGATESGTMDIIQIDPSNGEHYDRLLSDVIDDKAAPLRGLLYFWALDLPGVQNTTRADLDRATKNTANVFLLLQALFRFKQRRAMRFISSRDWGWAPRLWLMSRGSLGPQADDADAGRAASLVSTPLFGLSRVIMQEDPENLGSVIDLGRGLEPETAAKHVYAELFAEQGEDLVAFDEDGRHLPRLEPLLLDGLDAPPLRHDASYLVTGGFGGLGLAVARWLVEHGARRLILLGRSPLPPRHEWRQLIDTDRETDGEVDAVAVKVAAVLELEALGASVHTGALDVADHESLDVFLSDYDAAGWPAIRGIVHAAGIIDDSLIVHTPPEKIAPVMHAKVQGAWNLHQRFHDVDFFVLFSSLASWLGTFGESSYAAGNAFMDALARYRHSQGLPGLSIGWGPWAEVGMAARANLGEQHARDGMHGLTPAQGLELFHHALISGAPHVLAMGVEWPAWFRATVKAPALVSPFARQRSSDAKTAAASSGLRQEIIELESEDERRERVVDYVRDVVAGVMRIDPSRMAMERPTNELGIDSIMMAEVKQQIDAGLDLSLPIMELLAAPSFEHLAHTLLERLSDETKHYESPELGDVDASVPAGAGELAGSSL